MSVHNLSRMFQPGSVAVIGASDNPKSIGNVVMCNLLRAHFAGPIMPVNPRHLAVAGVLAYADVESLPLTPDLAVICTRADSVPGLLDRLGRRGTRAAVVVAADADREAMLAAARPWGLRLLGGASLGLQVPKMRLNASFAHLPALPGRVAFVSQSAALCTAVLDWARPRGIGFSAFVSLGDTADVGFDDLMDYLADDQDTRAILLYIEDIAERRDFMSAARAAARAKPLLWIKAGRSAAAAAAGPFVAEALALPDTVFNAATRRAGALRVTTIDELFGAVETLARTRPIDGTRLAILSNGGGTAQMAQDTLAREEGGGEVAPLAEATLARLAKVLPARWKPGNPIDLGFDADGKRYADAIAALGQATEVDGILVLNVPNALVDGVAVAEAVVAAQRACHISLLTCWLGGEAAAPARAVLSEAGLPTYESLSQAVGAFSHLVEYQAAQEKLMETPPAAPPGEAPPDRDSARTIIARALATADGLISDADCHALLAAYDIPVVETVTTTRAAGAAAVAAEQLGFPVVLSLASPDLPNKWESGLVALNLESAEAVRFAADEMLARIRRSHPEATVNGFAVQRMVLRPNARKLMIGIACDRLFGPVIVFGAGGRAPDVVRDHTIAFPPLNLAIARRVIERPRAARLLQAHGLRPAADHDAVAGVLVRLSRLLVDNPEIVACDINPLFADEQGALALDVRIRVAPLDESDRRRFSILPYPNHLAESARMKDGGAVRLRPIRPEDEPAHADMLSRTAPEDLRLRFFGVTRKLDHHQLAKLTQLDYQREMAIIATRPADDGQAETLAVMRTVTDPDNRTAELAILVRSDLKGRGLGTLLMDKILRYQRQRGTYEIVAHMLSENEGMRALARKFGLTPRPAEDPGMVSYGLVLNPPAEGAPG